jgi:hypothetical protein
MDGPDPTPTGRLGAVGHQFGSELPGPHLELEVEFPAEEAWVSARLPGWRRH